MTATTNQSEEFSERTNLSTNGPEIPDVLSLDRHSSIEGILDEPGGDGLQDHAPESNMVPPVEGRILEESIVIGQAINLDLFKGYDTTNELVRELTKEFRDGVGIKGVEKRQEFEAIIHAAPQIQNGSVSLDMLECGEVLCIMELRGNDEALLNDYSRIVMNSPGFDTYAMVRFAQEPGDSIGVSRRVLFSHDPNVVRLTTPDGSTIQTFEKSAE